MDYNLPVVKGIVCRFLGHIWVNDNCDPLPTSIGYSLFVKCRKECERCGFIEKYSVKWD